MARKKIPLKNWLIPRLRKLSLIWSGKTVARDLAKVKVDDGFFKNGNPRTKTMYLCNICKGLFPKEQTEMNHIEPVVDIKGFTNWDDYITRLFCEPAGFECLCKNCHADVTKNQNKARIRYGK